MVSTQSHLDIKAWLIVLDLQQYEGIHFTLYGSKLLNISFLAQKAFQSFLVLKSLCTSMKPISNSWVFGIRHIELEQFPVWLHYVINTKEVRYINYTCYCMKMQSLVKIKVRKQLLFITSAGCLRTFFVLTHKNLVRPNNRKLC